MTLYSLGIIFSAIIYVAVLIVLYKKAKPDSIYKLVVSIVYFAIAGLWSLCGYALLDMSFILFVVGICLIIISVSYAVIALIVRDKY